MYYWAVSPNPKARERSDGAAGLHVARPLHEWIGAAEGRGEIFELTHLRPNSLRSFFTPFRPPRSFRTSADCLAARFSAAAASLAAASSFCFFLSAAHI